MYKYKYGSDCVDNVPSEGHIRQRTEEQTSIYNDLGLEMVVHFYLEHGAIATAILESGKTATMRWTLADPLLFVDVTDIHGTVACRASAGGGTFNVSTIVHGGDCVP
jgi:hypothetical protein